jgi:three-Cys-motif partner protein
MTLQPHDDGLVIPEVGPWAKRKYHFLGRYLHAFTKAMREKWDELHFIDLFAGAGYAQIRTTNEIVFSSTILAATRIHPFTQIHACDRDPTKLGALKARLGKLKLTKPPHLILGDANTVIDSLIQSIPRQGALCVTFADPYGLHFDFETVKKIAALKSDLILLFADKMDALRNWEDHYRDNPSSSLDKFIGEPDWREVLATSPADHKAERLRKRYMKRLKTECGYEFFDDHIRVQNSHGQDLYSLVFASKSPAGLTIWRGISIIDEGGQRELPFM